MMGLRPLWTCPLPKHWATQPVDVLSTNPRIGRNGVPNADSTSRGVAAGRSAQRGTSGAATGGGGRSAPDPDPLGQAGHMGGMTDEVARHRAMPGEALVMRLTPVPAVVDLLDDHAELEVGESDIEVELGDVAAAQAGVE